MESGIIETVNMTNSFTQALQTTAVWWAPLVLLAVFAVVWTIYVRIRALSVMKTMLFEIPISNDASDIGNVVDAVAAVCGGIGYHTTLFGLYVRGSLRPWFSLELVFHEGFFRFFVWTDMRFKDIFISGLSARLHGIAPKEAIEYTDKILSGWAGSQLDIFVAEYAPDDAHALSARSVTYADIFESKSILGLARSLGNGESLCAQLICGTRQNADMRCGLRIAYAAGGNVFREEHVAVLLEPLTIAGAGKSGVLWPKCDTKHVSLLSDFFSSAGFRGVAEGLFSARFEPIHSAIFRAKKNAMLDAYARRAYFYPFLTGKSFSLALEKQHTAPISEIVPAQKDMRAEIIKQVENVAHTPALAMKARASTITRLPPENLPI